VRDALLAALVACANSRPSRSRTRRFLTGLSADELQFIAGYLGSRILGSVPSRDIRFRRTDAGVTAWRSDDQEHKMILLREFLGCTGMEQTPTRTRAWHWN
jgi:hypothetical protein